MPDPVIFPTIPLRMPVTRTLSVPVRVIPFLDGSEQRWADGDPLNAFDLTFANVQPEDITALETLIDTVKGAFDATWSFVAPDGVTYPHLGLEQDDLTAVESSIAERFTVSIKMRQVARDGAYADTATAVYPALPNGCYTQRPFTRARSWLTTRNDLASGSRVSWTERAAARRSWICEYPVLTWTELQGRLSFYVAMRGKLRTFTLRDPETGDDIENCRFDSDAIAIRCLGAGQWATSLPVTEIVSGLAPERTPVSVEFFCSASASCADPATTATIFGPYGTSWAAESGGTSGEASSSISPPGGGFTADFRMGHSLFWVAGSSADYAHGTVSGVRLEYTYADGSVRIKRPRSLTVGFSGSEGTASVSGSVATFVITHTGGLLDLPWVRFGDFRWSL
jgi:hypothetical protein